MALEVVTPGIQQNRSNRGIVVAVALFLQLMGLTILLVGAVVAIIGIAVLRWGWQLIHGGLQ